MEQSRSDTPETTAVRPMFRYLAAIIAVVGVLGFPPILGLELRTRGVAWMLLTLVLEAPFLFGCAHIAVTGRAPRWFG